jgi:hypothetical protein
LEFAQVAPPPISVASIGELAKVEREAVSRLNESPRSAELFLTDPVGALASVGILVSEEAAVEWGRLIGGTLPSLPQQTRDLLIGSNAGIQLNVKIQGILPPAAASEAVRKP